MRKGDDSGLCEEARSAALHRRRQILGPRRTPFPGRCAPRRQADKGRVALACITRACPTEYPCAATSTTSHVRKGDRSHRSKAKSAWGSGRAIEPDEQPALRGIRSVQGRLTGRAFATDRGCSSALNCSACQARRAVHIPAPRSRVSQTPFSRVAGEEDEAVYRCDGRG